jgi:hypothetical protein
VLLTLPFAWNEHEMPFDFARYTSAGISHIVRRAGFEIVSLEKTGCFIESLFQLSTAYIHQRLFPGNKVAALLMTPFILAPLNLLGILLGAMLPKDHSFYQNTVLLLRKSPAPSSRGVEV